jgi:uncharacterized protein (AIM24 family)
MSTDTPIAPYLCRFCRLPSDGTAASCPNCGSPVDVRARVSDSGWAEQPPVRDMARIQFGRSTCQIEGTIVPTADMSLVDTDSVYFSHHVLLWAEPSVTMSPMPMKGGWNRMLAGMPLIMMQAHGPGHVAFSEDAPGELVVIPLQHGQEVDVREHRFLVAGANVTYDWFQSNIWYTTSSGNDSETHYPLGRFLDRFRSEGGPGLLLLHSPGNTFVRDLQAGEAICIQPSALLYKDPGVGMMLHFEYPNAQGSSWGGGYTSRTVWLRLWGPGRVAVQSVFERPESGRAISRHSDATQTQW